MTLSEEDYIKTIYHLSTEGKGGIATNAIAEQMATRPSSVTDMLKKLSEKDLVHYKKYKGVSLTGLGEKSALSIIRKHRLWEVFLVEKLDFNWDEVHEVAEQLEHIKSEQLIDKLDIFLGSPKIDPHGDPIPSKEGKFVKVVKKLLNELPVGTQGTCVGVLDSSSTFLKFLDKHGISLGDVVTIKDKEEFDGSYAIIVKDREMNISKQIASNIYIEVLDTDKNI